MAEHELIEQIRSQTRLTADNLNELIQSGDLHPKVEEDLREVWEKLALATASLVGVIWLSRRLSAEETE